MPMLAPCRRSRQDGYRLLAAIASLALLLLVATAPTISVAQPSTERVDELLKRGSAALRSNRPLEALSAWHAAWALQPSHTTACNIGHAERLYGSNRIAAEFLSICLRISPAPTTLEDKKRRSQFSEDFKQAQAQVASITVETNQNGASILLDGRYIGRSPLPDPIFVDPGKHSLSAMLQGFKSADVSVIAEKGKTQHASIALVETALPKKENTPLPLVPVVRKARADTDTPPLSKGVIVAGTSFATLSFALGGALLIAQTVVNGTAQDSREEIRLGVLVDCAPGKAAQAACSEYLSSQRDRATMKTIATVSLIGAGAAAAATVAYVLFPRSPIFHAIGASDGVKISF